MQKCSKCGQPLPQILRDRLGTEITIQDAMLWIPSLYESDKLGGSFYIVILNNITIDQCRGTYKLRGVTTLGGDFRRDGLLGDPVSDLISLHADYITIRDALDWLHDNRRGD